MQSGELSKVSMKFNNWKLLRCRIIFPSKLSFSIFENNLVINAWDTYDITTGLTESVIRKASKYDFIRSNKTQL
jgi:hypothetical protein